MEGDRDKTGGVPLRDILAANFCANRDYRLVLFDRLPPDQQEVLRDLTKDPEFYGVLLPPEGSSRKAKSVCQSTALLLFTLMEPGPLPAYVPSTLGATANQAIAELVLDEVLMIEHEGRFVCGSAAYELLYSEPRSESSTCAAAADLTRAALEYAQSLDLDDSNLLSARLYAYNRVPLSPRWKRLLPNREAVARWLGIESGGALRPLLEERWDRVRVTAQSEGWFQWTSPEKRASSEAGETGYKLYVSPMPDHTPDAFKAVVECLADSDAYHFKVGDDAYGLLRPDKIVIYFRSFAALEETGRRIAARLVDCPAQGVPFAAALDGSDLLSWGVDPPRQSGVLAWQERESWRLWITNRVAVAMVAAKQSQNARLAPWRFALERLRLDAIDTDTWTPMAGFGRSAAHPVAVGES
uniref:Uncharacterized protein n=1 Tax=uncultured bacterium RM57 TaxID=561246 RepID=C8XT95_9BACT|nr:hypothetical protein [uncultured bacterium RM57]